MTNTKIEREIEKILTNNFKKSHIGGNPKLLSKEQLKTLKKYKEYYANKKSSKGGTIKITSVLNSIHVIRMLGVYLNKPYEEATKNDLVDYFTKHNKNKAIATLSNWKVIIRSFYKWMHGMRKKNEFPDIVDDERLEPVKAKPRNISPSDLYTKDDVAKMLSVCRNAMDKSIISIWFEMGLRAKEYITANVGSVEFVSGGAKFYVEESKTETGFVPLIQSAPYLQEWLSAHPYKDNPKAPLFIGLASYYGDRLQPNAINQKLKRIAKKAGINKRIFTHLGRNISITNLDGRMSVEDNARIHGITPSTILNVYTRRTRREACEKYFNINGRVKTDKELIAEKKEEEKLLPKECANCGEMNPYDRNFCLKCLRPVDLQTFVELEKNRDIRDRAVRRSVNDGKVLSENTITQVIREMKDSGEIKDLLKEMIRNGDF